MDSLMLILHWTGAELMAHRPQPDDTMPAAAAGNPGGAPDDDDSSG
ncbi:hypothetical protein IMZ11_41135 [Microtetraspora sp. AC03309]|nr:hypothetical protein [Microtetraspora sp. AC03309]MCC5582023.1 hypothetical protein [Microtetraspora sp. AC03309]